MPRLAVGAGTAGAGHRRPGGRRRTPYHLDIETDDVEAETTRLLALGAERPVHGRSGVTGSRPLAVNSRP
ncbi:VOC family protein [Streptomyces rapamycinicus]|uniref:VOC family protein n=1 Tax=Streptomyces rapamycinicus TaxID=1226757 RepID=UPI00041BD753|nr:hypothetical protein LJB45_19190 [Streptomyces rapamycinicus]UTP32196.1 hypothetical protein LIV37_24310 [Streptomyces rapamycinicus NRRL 5491]